MTRNTADLIADLRILADAYDTSSDFIEASAFREAADRLSELDAVDRMRTALAVGRDALLPPCPTCDGKGGIATASTAPDPYGYISGAIIPCPDCVDGKVSIEQLVATYNAVYGPIFNMIPMFRPCLQRLRRVTP